MRAAIRNLIIAQPTITALIPPSRWFAPGSVVDTPVKPFAVLRWLAPVPGNGRRTLNQLRVDVHDVRGSYKRIEDILGNPDTGGGVYEVLSGVLQHVGADGRISQCDYLGHSGDQEDPTYGTNFKFSSWQVIGVNL